jgi:hypothetical protein
VAGEIVRARRVRMAKSAASARARGRINPVAAKVDRVVEIAVAAAVIEAVPVRDRRVRGKSGADPIALAAMKAAMSKGVRRA